MTRPLLVIVGETAAGKSALALKLAEQFKGEIISGDSRTIYKGMDIGTAKPTAEEQARVRHHLIDVAAPDQEFTAADFKKLANQAIEDIGNRGKLPIIAGGSGLYIDSVLFDYKFRVPGGGSREVLNKKSVTELQLMLLERGLPMPENDKNPRHLIRVIETDGIVTARSQIRPKTLVLGLQPTREELKQRVSERIDNMIEHGLVDEIRQLAERYGWQNEALQAPAYKAFRSYVKGEETLQNAKQKFIQNDLQLAKRQRTWFRRNKSIQWISTPINWQAVVDTVTTFLES